MLLTLLDEAQKYHSRNSRHLEMREARKEQIFIFFFSPLLEEAMQAMRGRWIAIPTAVSSGAVRAPHGGFCTVVYVQALPAAASC